MEARLLRLAVVLSVFASAGASYRTPNFVVHAPSEEVARQVALTAERCRDEIAVEWLGRKLPGKWSRPCEIQVKVGQIGAGGATTFSFHPDRSGQMHVFGWKMTVQGTLERILDSVIPHEVSHTVFATHFRRPLPRWADEGAATLVEHESERRRQRLLLEQIMKTNERIPLRKLLAMKEYPREMRQVMTLYAEGYSLADFLVQKGGKARYLQFLDDAHREGWDQAIQQHYSFGNVESLEQRWNGWVMAGSPPLSRPDGSLLADANAATSGGARDARGVPDDRGVVRESRPVGGTLVSDGRRGRSGVVIRSQNPELEQAERDPRGRSDEMAGGAEFQAPVPRSGSGASLAADADPGRDARPHRAEESIAGATAGRSRTLNDGWVPVIRRSRPESLPERERRPAEAMGEERETPPGGRPEWSEFPRGRSDAGPTRLGRANGGPDSP